MTNGINVNIQQIRRKSKKVLTPIAFCGPYIIFFIAFVFIPFCLSIAMSLFKWDTSGNYYYVGFENYKNLFSFNSPNFEYYWYGQFWKYLGNTVLFVLIQTPITIIIPLLLAVLLNQKLKGTTFYRAIIYFPCILSISTVGLIWKFILDDSDGLGILNKIIGSNIPWISGQPYAWISIFLLSTWWGLGGNTTLFLAGLQGISDELYEACSVDGGRRFSKLIHVTVPGLSSTFTYVLITTIISSFNVFGQPYILTAGGPKDSTTVVVQHIFNYSNDYGSACTMGTMLALIMLVFSIFSLISIKKREEGK